MSVLQSVERMVAGLTLDDHGQSLSEVAVRLAGLLDDDELSARDAATVAKELRACLDALKPEAVDVDHDWTAVAGVASIRDAKGRESGDVRARSGGRSKAARVGADAAPASRVGRRART